LVQLIETFGNHFPSGNTLLISRKGKVSDALRHKPWRAFPVLALDLNGARPKFSIIGHL